MLQGLLNKRTNCSDLESYIENKDYTGALTLLEFKKRSIKNNEIEDILMWIAYCLFHSYQYERSLEVYEELIRICDQKGIINYVACCKLSLKLTDEAEKDADSGPDCDLKKRIQLHIINIQDDEAKLMGAFEDLSDSCLLNQLSLASVHFLRNNYKEASSIYNRLLAENTELIALHYYIALCYYKMDYYDVSLDTLSIYLRSDPNSVLGTNLKACNLFRLYNGEAATNQLNSLLEFGRGVENIDCIKHNRVAFNDGKGALQILPPLVHKIPEARLNLVIYNLRKNNVQEANELIADFEPSNAQGYILKGIVYAAVGQMTDNDDYISMAQEYFQVVGTSENDCNTIPGRQCMASCFFLMKQYEKANVYLNSVKAFMYNDDSFNWNHGISLAAMGNFRAAEDSLLLVENESFRQDYIYQSWLARCYIMNKNPSSAWELYLSLPLEKQDERCNLLHLIANDCYATGQFLFAAKAFNELEKHDSTLDCWEGKRGACVGVFQLVLAGMLDKEKLHEILGILYDSDNAQAEYIARTIEKWTKFNGINAP